MVFDNLRAGDEYGVRTVAPSVPVRRGRRTTLNIPIRLVLTYLLWGWVTMREMSASYHVVREYRAVGIGSRVELGWEVRRYLLSAATMIENAEKWRTDHTTVKWKCKEKKTWVRRVNRVVFPNYDSSNRTIARCWVGRNCGEVFLPNNMDESGTYISQDTSAVPKNFNSAVVLDLITTFKNVYAIVYIFIGTT